METELSEKSNDEKSQGLDNNATFFQIDNTSSLNELLPGVSHQDKWITMLGENGLILTRSDSSSDEQVQSSSNESVQNLLQNTTTSVISVGEGENAESYIVIKSVPELSTPGSILSTSYTSNGQAETIVDIKIDSLSGSNFSDDIGAKNILQKDLSTPVSERSVMVEEIHSNDFITQARESIQVEIETRNASTSDDDKDEAMENNSTKTDEIELQSVTGRSNMESIENNFPKEKVENAIEELNEFISRGQEMNSNYDKESESKLAEAHRYLTEYVQQIQESGIGQDRIHDDSKEENEYDSDEKDSVGNKKENAEKLLVRKLKARTLSESEKVAAVEGLIQMSQSTVNTQSDAQKCLIDALKAGVKNIQRDNETYDAIEGLMEIGNTPMQQLEKFQKTTDMEKSQETQEEEKSKPTVKTLQDLLSKNEETGMLMIKSLPYKIYRCVNCEHTFVNADEVRAISRSADFRRLYMCHECHSSKQDGFVHKCRLCGAGFQAIRGLEKHFENHELKYIYRCDYCGKGFGYHGRNRYLSHERTHKGPNPCFCSICGMQFSRPVYLHMHTEKTHKRKKMHFCEICGQFFTSLDLLRTHYRSQHFCYDTLSSHVSDYRCGICNEVYPSLYMLNTHLVIHTRLSQGFEDMYDCLVCHKRFKNVRNLQKHHIRSHPDQHLYSCHICNKEFQSASVRDIHLYKAHNIKTEVGDLEEQKPKVKTELVVREEIMCRSEGQSEVISGQSILTQEKFTGNDSQEIAKSTKGDNSVNLKTMTYKSNKIGDDSTTEVVFGGTDVEESEPTILVEMKNPRLDTTLNKNSRKMMSLLTPQSLAMLQKAKVETGDPLKEERDTELNKPQTQGIVGSKLRGNDDVDEINTGNERDPNNSKSGEPRDIPGTSEEQSKICYNLTSSEKVIKLSDQNYNSSTTPGLEKLPVDANIERQKLRKLPSKQHQEETGNIYDGVKLDEAKSLKCDNVKEAGKSENSKQEIVTIGKDTMLESLNKGDNSHRERKRKTNGKSSETESKQKKLNVNSDKNVKKQSNDVNKSSERIEIASDIKMEEVTETRKSSRKIRHTWKYLESVDAEMEKNLNIVNRDTRKEKTPEKSSSNTDTGIGLKEMTESCGVSEYGENIANSNFLSKKGEKKVKLEAVKTSVLNNSKNKSVKFNDSSRNNTDQNCCVVLEDIKQIVDEEMSTASIDSASWSKKFQEFVDLSSGKELKRKKMTSDTDVKEMDTGMKKIFKK